MCNLYSMVASQAAIAEFGRVDRDTTGNLPPFPALFPDQKAPVIRQVADGRELIMMRWGMPGPAKAGGPPVTNIRNTRSPYWRRLPHGQVAPAVPRQSFGTRA